MPHLTTSAGDLHYDVNGPSHAPVLVLSNSLGSDLSMWDGQLAALAGPYRVVRYDTRGHGRSGIPQGPSTIEDLGRDVVSLLDGLNIERAHFCGLSLGGMVGMWLGANAADRLHSIVLSNTSAKLGPAAMWNDRIDLVRSKGMAAVSELILERWFTPSFRSSAPGVVERCRQMLLGTPPDGYASCCAAIRDMDQVEAIGSIDNPTLVVIGQDDPSTPPAHGELVAGRIRGAATVSLPAAHLSNIEARAAYNEALLSFLTGTRRLM